MNSSSSGSALVNFNYADWPPALTKTQLEALTAHATTYALSHGLLYLPQTIPVPIVPSSAIHAPLAIMPSPFPRKLFDKARRLQRIYNILYSRITMDEEFLDRVMGTEEGVGKVDEFIGRLWRGWKQLRDEGIAQPFHLGIFRSDYMLHNIDGKGPLSLKQVELNTISASFGTLSQRVAELHRHLQNTTGYYNASPQLRIENYPGNNTIAGLAAGLAAAHKAYGAQNSYILVVTQENERNLFDQKWLEYELSERHSIRMLRQTLTELGTSARVDSDTRKLYVNVPTDLFPSGAVEISVVYYRSCYIPGDHPTNAHYTTRFLMERSTAIKCPSLALQLAGGKKVQEVLTREGMLEKFLADDTKYKEVFSAEDIQELRGTFMAMWGLDVGGDLLKPDTQAIQSGRENIGVRKAREEAHSLVLKPQREGGGHNVYKEDIPPFLDSLPPQERQAWIAMQLIVPPSGAGNYLIRAGDSVGTSKSQTPVKVDVISELGIFGWTLFGKDGLDEHIQEDTVGWLLRTKSKDNNEGGVASGFSVLDSVVLVDSP